MTGDNAKRMRAKFLSEWTLQERIELYVEQEWTLEATWNTLKDDYKQLTKRKLEKTMQAIADRKGLWLFREPPEPEYLREQGGFLVSDIMDYNRKLQKEAGVKPKDYEIHKYMSLSCIIKSTGRGPLQNRLIRKEGKQMKREIVKIENVLERHKLEIHGGRSVEKFEKLNDREVSNETYYTSAIEWYNGVEWGDGTPDEMETFNTLEQAVKAFNEKRKEFSVDFSEVIADGWRVVMYTYYSNGDIEQDVVIEHEWKGEDNPWWVKKNENSEENNEEQVDELYNYNYTEYKKLREAFKEANPEEDEDDRWEMARWTQAVNYFKFKAN